VGKKEFEEALEMKECWAGSEEFTEDRAGSRDPFISLTWFNPE
jgi:hypothetical protein